LKSERLIALLLWVALLVMSLSCSDVPCEPDPDPLQGIKEKLAQTPRADKEAEEMALWLSGELVAPETLYTQLRDAVSVLRSAYADYPEVQMIRFVLPFETSRIGLKLDTAAAARYLNGEYNDWDSLNALFGVETIEEVFESHFLHFRSLTIRFSGRLHPQLLADVYSQLPGVEWAYPSYWTNDSSNLYPWKQSSAWTFLLRKGWTDCWNSCQDNHFWYFRVRSAEVELVGDFRLIRDPLPGWWSEGRTAFCEYFGYTEEFCAGE
jgi:hypothetical protein